MPSPVGHALGGMAFGWLLARRGLSSSASTSSPRSSSAPESDRGFARTLRDILLSPWTIGFAFLGALADIDFLIGTHSAQTHSLGAVLIVLVVATFAGRRPDWRRGVACAAAYGSHVLFDWMGNDTTPPIGIMALWPFTDSYYQSNLYVFEAISRRYWLPNFWTHNGLAVLREIVIVAPLTAAVLWHRRLRRSPRPADRIAFFDVYHPPEG